MYGKRRHHSRINRSRCFILWTFSRYRDSRFQRRNISRIIFIFSTYTKMKARQITTTHKYWEHYDHVFKHYANALEFRMRTRANNLKHKRDRVKMSQIKEIEVADDYRKKDFWKHLTVHLWKNWFEWSWKWREDTTETEYLSSHILYRIHHEIRCSTATVWWLDRNNPDVKFMLEDLQRYNETSLPKNVKLEQQKELFFSCRKILRKLWYERFISEKDRWMYEDEFNEYCERMEAMQQELNAMLV